MARGPSHAVFHSKVGYAMIVDLRMLKRNGPILHRSLSIHAKFLSSLVGSNFGNPACNL
jgi:hypothetical protein